MNFAALRVALHRTTTIYAPRRCGYSTFPAGTGRPKCSRAMSQLYRLTRRADTNALLAPFLDHWLQHRTIHKHQLRLFIEELRHTKRYNHALEVSFWMTDKGRFELTSQDVAARLDLVGKVHGIEQAEVYFKNIPPRLKAFTVYMALLRCFGDKKSVEKAENVMQEMKKLGFAKTSSFNTYMMNFYYQIGNIQKLQSVIREMDENGIDCDQFGYSIQMSAYAAASDIEGMEKTLTRMESDPKVVLDWDAYSAVASAYRKVGLLDKALKFLKKSEELVTGGRRGAYNFLITQYAAIGKKDAVLRIWELYKAKGEIRNQEYITIITSLLKLNDFESAEKIFEEWEGLNSYYNMLIPNFLIDAYSKIGLLERAERIINKVISRGKKPNAKAWSCLASGYLQRNQTWKALDAMDEAVAVARRGWRPSDESLAACVEYLKGKGDLKRAKAFIKLFKDKDLISSDVKEKLLNQIRKGTPTSEGLGALDESSVKKVEDGFSDPAVDDSRDRKLLLPDFEKRGCDTSQVEKTTASGKSHVPFG